MYCLPYAGIPIHAWRQRWYIRDHSFDEKTVNPGSFSIAMFQFKVRAVEVDWSLLSLQIPSGGRDLIVLDDLLLFVS
ncbi:hypothetical protein V6N13_061951 [Hibiscus sabdariffa]